MFLFGSGDGIWNWKPFLVLLQNVLMNFSQCHLSHYVAIYEILNWSIHYNYEKWFVNNCSKDKSCHPGPQLRVYSFTFIICLSCANLFVLWLMLGLPSQTGSIIGQGLGYKKNLGLYIFLYFTMCFTETLCLDFYIFFLGLLNCSPPY